MTTPRRGFTLLELIVTIGLILILASIVIVAVGGVRAAASRTDSASALRSMAVGYNAYPNGTTADYDTNTADLSSYVWRLSPYVEDEWGYAFKDYRNRELDSELKREVLAGVFGPASMDPTGGGSEIGAARTPSFGLNSIFLGGDDVHGGPAAVARNPWDNPGDTLAVTRFSEVKAPGRVIVFAPVVYWGDADADPSNNLIPEPPVSNVRFGYSELRPPFLVLDDSGADAIWTQQQWELDSNGEIRRASGADYNEGGGWPIARWGDSLPVVHLDGSVTTHGIPQLFDDMRLWAPAVAGDFKTEAQQ
jgi:prepilin-type N-terminal cleavage/methylation domain-containing protein